MKATAKGCKWLGSCQANIVRVEEARGNVESIGRKLKAGKGKKHRGRGLTGKWEGWILVHIGRA
jgi:hypothetical protein